jgi:tetratricopeptide (TPR) repeat protein
MLIQLFQIRIMPIFQDATAYQCAAQSFTLKQDWKFSAIFGIINFGINRRLLLMTVGSAGNIRVYIRSIQAVFAGLAAIACVVCSSCASIDYSKRQPFEEYFESGVSAMARGQDEKARTMFELAVQRNSSHPYPHYYLGVLYNESGDLEMAAVAFQRAIELMPSFFEAYHNLGTVRLKQRQLTAAVAALEKAVELMPDHVSSFNNLGKAYYMVGLPELAGAAYEEALARDPENVIALENLFMLARAAGADEAAQEYSSRLRGPRRRGRK